MLAKKLVSITVMDAYDSLGISFGFFSKQRYRDFLSQETVVQQCFVETKREEYIKLTKFHMNLITRFSCVIGMVITYVFSQACCAN